MGTAVPLMVAAASPVGCWISDMATATFAAWASAASVGSTVGMGVVSTGVLLSAIAGVTVANVSSAVGAAVEVALAELQAAVESTTKRAGHDQ